MGHVPCQFRPPTTEAVFFSFIEPEYEGALSVTPRVYLLLSLQGSRKSCQALGTKDRDSDHRISTSWLEPWAVHSVSVSSSIKCPLYSTSQDIWPRNRTTIWNSTHCSWFPMLIIFPFHPVPTLLPQLTLGVILCLLKHRIRTRIGGIW